MVVVAAAVIATMTVPPLKHQVQQQQRNTNPPAGQYGMCPLGQLDAVHVPLSVHTLGSMTLVDSQWNCAGQLALRESEAPRLHHEPSGHGIRVRPATGDAEKDEKDGGGRRREVRRARQPVLHRQQLRGTKNRGADQDRYGTVIQTHNRAGHTVGPQKHTTTHT
jgi:hypothetical protein